MLSRSLVQDRDNPTYMEALSDREDCTCESFQRSTEEDLVVRERIPSRNDSTSVREPGTNGKHVPIGQAQNDGSSDNSQEIPVSMDNVRPEGTEDQSIKSADREDLRRNVHVERSKN